MFAKSTWEEGNGGLLKPLQRKEMGKTPINRGHPADEDLTVGLEEGEGVKTFSS